MALETLNCIEKIDGFEVTEILGNGEFQAPERNSGFITVDQRFNSISFKIQKGQVGETGVNGCQVDTIIAATIKIIESLNRNIPCPENEEAMLHLDKAFIALKNRKRDKRGVEGTNNK